MAASAASKRLKGKSYREAAERSQKSKKLATKETSSPKAAAAKSTKDSRLIMEVVIEVPPGHPLNGQDSKSLRSKEDDGSDSDKQPPRKLGQRAATKRVVVISDDESGSEDDGQKSQSKKTVKSSKHIPKKRKKGLSKASSPSSDYEESPAEQSDSDVEMDPSSSDNDGEGEEEESNPSRGKSKAISKPKLKPKAQPTKAKKPRKSPSLPPTSDSNYETEGDRDEMDIDEPAPKKKVTKRKAGDNDERPAKKAKRADTDPWKLESKAVRKDWTQMQAPPFEIFHFARKVVDEYTYLDGKIHSLITSLTAERQWVLSGTPPIHDFAALKTIAAFLNIHLGVDDDGEGQSVEVKKRRREQTGKHHALVLW